MFSCRFKAGAPKRSLQVGVSIEQEAVAVDGALEEVEARLGAIRDAVATLDDAALTTGAPGLLAQVGAVRARLRTIPHAVVEPTEICVDPPPAQAPCTLGRIVSPLGASSAQNLRIRDGAVAVRRARLCHCRLCRV